jgi:hypothetical protein
VLGDVDRGAAIFATERQALHQPQRDQHDRRDDAPARIARQHADEECTETHQRHGDEESVFAADQVAEPAEDQGAERAHCETCGIGQERENKTDRLRHVGEEIFRQKYAERAVNVKVIPFENGAERGGKDDQAFFASHAAGAAHSVRADRVRWCSCAK